MKYSTLKISRSMCKLIHLYCIDYCGNYFICTFIACYSSSVEAYTNYGWYRQVNQPTSTTESSDRDDTASSAVDSSSTSSSSVCTCQACEAKAIIARQETARHLNQYQCSAHDVLHYISIHNPELLEHVPGSQSNVSQYYELHELLERLQICHTPESSVLGAHDSASERHDLSSQDAGSERVDSEQSGVEDIVDDMDDSFTHLASRHFHEGGGLARDQESSSVNPLPVQPSGVAVQPAAPAAPPAGAVQAAVPALPGAVQAVPPIPVGVHPAAAAAVLLPPPVGVNGALPIHPPSSPSSAYSQDSADPPVMHITTGPTRAVTVSSSSSRSLLTNQRHVNGGNRGRLQRNVFDLASSSSQASIGVLPHFSGSSTTSEQHVDEYVADVVPDEAELDVGEEEDDDTLEGAPLSPSPNDQIVPEHEQEHPESVQSDSSSSSDISPVRRNPHRPRILSSGSDDTEEEQQNPSRPQVVSSDSNDAQEQAENTCKQEAGVEHPHRRGDDDDDKGGPSEQQQQEPAQRVPRASGRQGISSSSSSSSTSSSRNNNNNTSTQRRPAATTRNLRSYSLPSTSTTTTTTRSLKMKRAAQNKSLLISLQQRLIEDKLKSMTACVASSTRSGANRFPKTTTKRGKGRGKSSQT